MSDQHITRRHPEMEKFTQIKPIVMEGHPEACTLCLAVGGQSFVIGTYGYESVEEAEWMRDMLCTALAKIVNEMKPCPPSAHTEEGTK